VRIYIQERDLVLSGAERSYLEDRLALTLGRFSAKIAKVVVALSSAALATGRLDKRCRIDVDLLPETVHVEDEDTDLRTALDRATGRLARTVARALERSGRS